MISLNSLSIGYQQKNNQKVVAENISSVIRPGELTCLIGPNGVGKSTLLRTLSAFQPPLSGEIYVDEKNLAQLSDLTTKPDVQNMTVSELVALGRAPYTGFWGRLNKDDQEVVRQSIQMVGIKELSERMVQTLSDGERQKMMIAKALAQQTPVIYLDEPTAFLDYPSKVEILHLLKKLSRETQKTQMADTLWLMQPKQPIAIGSPQELASNGSLGQFLNRPGLHFDAQHMSIQVQL